MILIKIDKIIKIIKCKVFKKKELKMVFLYLMKELSYLETCKIPIKKEKISKEEYIFEVIYYNNKLGTYKWQGSQRKFR